MSVFDMEMGFSVTDYGTSEDLENFLDCVLDGLYEDNRVVDPDYAATLARGTVEFTMVVEAPTELHAMEIALVAIRAAAHAAEGCTPGWEAKFKQIRTEIRANELVDA